MEEKLTTLEKYGYIYHMVGMNPITRKELREKIKKDSPKMSETTLKKYSDAPFDGAYPMFVVKEDKATLDITAFRSFIEELCKYVGTDAAVLFTGSSCTWRTKRVTIRRLRRFQIKQKIRRFLLSARRTQNCQSRLQI